MRIRRFRRLMLRMLVGLATLFVVGVGVGLAQLSNVSPTPLWGYEAAAANAAISLYDIGAGVLVSSCVPAGGAVPPHALGNGRGVAYDPIDGNLWYTVLNANILTGDGLIHKTSTTCGADILTIPAPQTSIGALDIDPDDGHIWAAGYQPIGNFSFLYKVSRGTPGPPPGTVMQSCKVPFAGGGVGNDTLAVAKLRDLPGSGKYLLTDAGELIVGPGNLKVIDAAACVGGSQVTPVTSYTTPIGLTGIDYERVGCPPVRKLIAANLSSIVDLGGPPFSTILATMSTFGHALEDITLKTAPIEDDDESESEGENARALPRRLIAGAESERERTPERCRED